MATDEVDHKHISRAAFDLLAELRDMPRVIGFDHRIKELDAKRLIQWEPGFGYIASVAGKALLGNITPERIIES